MHNILQYYDFTYLLVEIAVMINNSDSSLWSTEQWMEW